MIRIKKKQAKELYLGYTKVFSAYLGRKKVFPATQVFSPSKFYHTSFTSYIGKKNVEMVINSDEAYEAWFTTKTNNWKPSLSYVNKIGWTAPNGSYYSTWTKGEDGKWYCRLENVLTTNQYIPTFEMNANPATLQGLSEVSKQEVLNSYFNTAWTYISYKVFTIEEDENTYRLILNTMYDDTGTDTYFMTSDEEYFMTNDNKYLTLNT